MVVEETAVEATSAVEDLSAVDLRVAVANNNAIPLEFQARRNLRLVRKPSPR